MKRLRGFTIVELLVVVTVIGILTTIGVLTYAKVQSDARDSQRSVSVTVIAEALEKYYNQNGEYPSCNAMTQPSTTVTTTTLKGTDEAVLTTPTASPQTNSITCASLSGGSGPDSFAYVGDGSAACTGSQSCLRWTLQYREESTGQIKTISSRHTTQIATSGAPTVTATAAGFNQINLSWSTVSNATSYTIQRTTDSTFVSGITGSTATTPTASATGLTAATTYYFRVAANATGNQGNWSSKVSAKTATLGAPTISATANSSTQVTVSWAAVPSASSYTLQQQANSGSFTSPTTTSGLGGTSRVITGLTAGTTYYYRLQSVATGATSVWSNTDTALYVAAPTGVAATTNSSSQITASWAAISGATSYNVEYSTSSGFASSSTATGVTGTSKAITGLISGQRYYFRVYALIGSIASGASASVSGVTTINAPSAPVVAQSTSGATTTYSWPAVTCAVAGTTVRYQYSLVTNYGYTSPWYGTTARSSSFGTSSEGYQYTGRTQAQCYNGVTSSGWSAVGQISYIRPVNGPGPISFGIRRGASNIVWVSATSSCTGGADLYARADIHSWNYTWSGTGQLGWYANAHGGVWLISNWSYFGNTVEIGAQNNSGAYSSGSGWNIAVELKCQNSSTLWASGSTGRIESGRMNLP